MTLSTPCPCTPDKLYADCCQPFHVGRGVAPTAEQLMRSRYSAWALGLIDYIIQTTAIKQQPALVPAEMRQWANEAKWQRLEVIDTLAGSADDNFGEVEFKAYFTLPDDEQIHTHHERSHFAKDNDRWYFLDPNILARSARLAGRNDPCPCASGKKYKKCCG